jgi:outer membrane immunogenic protein
MLNDDPAFAVEKRKKGRLMRRFVYALILFALASPAAAADVGYDFLRGSDTVGPGTYSRWSGFYIGGQVGYGWATTDFSGSTAPEIAYVLRETSLLQSFNPSQWPVLGSATSPAPQFGGFVGYNTQFEDLVFGVEANLERAAFHLVAPNNPISRATGPDNLGIAHDVTVTGSGTVDTMEFATFKARAGYVVGNFMPYGFAGFALGLVNSSVTGTVFDQEFSSGNINTCNATAPCPSFRFSNSATHNNQVIYGYAVGGGVDVALTPNVFARFEMELDEFNMQPSLMLTAVSARVGAGYRF